MEAWGVSRFFGVLRFQRGGFALGARWRARVSLKGSRMIS